MYLYAMHLCYVLFLFHIVAVSHHHSSRLTFSYNLCDMGIVSLIHRSTLFPITMDVGTATI
ncbi:hypothetical protein HanRHA438_Chr03g0119481 [Helianthus annuus]|nr:hypothetical protein HanRHA438_Chr03g0119481 [Helianthus annuus]